MSKLNSLHICNFSYSIKAYLCVKGGGDSLLSIDKNHRRECTAEVFDFVSHFTVAEIIS